MLAARVPCARTCICCIEIEVVGPAGREAEVNAAGLTTGSRGSSVQSTNPQTLAHTYVVSQCRYVSISFRKNRT